jgi:N-acetylmuramoyl-L-alanine amidase
VRQPSGDKAGALREALVRDLVKRNLVQLGKLEPEPPPAAEAFAGARDVQIVPGPAAPRRPPERRRGRLRGFVLAVCLGSVSVFGTSAFRQDVPGGRTARPASAPVWNAELLEDLDAAVQSPHGLPMSLAQMLHLRVGRIVLDPGHGGRDPGCRAGSGLEEKTVTLDIARRLAPILEKRLGAEVILTRENDTFVPLEERAERANRLEADLFVSIHLNWFPAATIQRVETYYVGLSTDKEALEVARRENASGDVRFAELDEILRRMAQTVKVQESGRLAEMVQEALYKSMKQQNPKLRNRGVRRAPFVVLMGTKMPSILAEVSFLSDPDEVKRLESPSYLDTIAEALADGIAPYLSAEANVAAAKADAASRR